MAEIEQFQRLEQRLITIWNAVHERPDFEHTSVIVPSQSVDQEELAKIEGAPFYEERLLFTLIRLRNPNARLVYITSQPLHPDVVDYYIHLLPGVPASHARARLKLLCLYDASPRPLTEKVLERPRVMARLREWIGDPKRAYLTCFNSTALERQLALALGIPLNGVDPELLDYGTKSGSREIFAEAGVPFPPGYERLHSEDQLVEALFRLAGAQPGLKKAVLKLNESFSGEGNGIYAFPKNLPDDEGQRRERIAEGLGRVQWSYAEQTHEVFLRKLGAGGGIVEAFVDADEVRSPSVQMRIQPDGRPALVSSHEQVLGGATGQVYLGCRFPARDDYRELIQINAMKIAEVLSRRGVIGRFGIDFVVTRSRGDPWRAHAIEINLRMGGTTPPFFALQFLTGGRLDPESGLFLSPEGWHKFYYATDNLKSQAYKGLLLEDLMDVLARCGLHYRHATGSGALFYLFGALSQFGKVGVTCVGNSRDEADALFHHTVEILDRETGASARSGGRPMPLIDKPFLGME